jgi:hypothetical protein
VAYTGILAGSFDAGWTGPEMPGFLGGSCMTAIIPVALTEFIDSSAFPAPVTDNEACSLAVQGPARQFSLAIQAGNAKIRMTAIASPIMTNLQYFISIPTGWNTRQV